MIDVNVCWVLNVGIIGEEGCHRVETSYIYIYIYIVLYIYIYIYIYL